MLPQFQLLQHLLPECLPCLKYCLLVPEQNSHVACRHAVVLSLLPGYGCHPVEEYRRPLDQYRPVIGDVASLERLGQWGSPRALNTSGSPS